jgi:hypothetical protein
VFRAGVAAEHEANGPAKTVQDRALAKCPSLGIAHARSHSRNTIGL